MAIVVPDGAGGYEFVFKIPKEAFLYATSAKRLTQGEYGNTTTTYCGAQVIIEEANIKYNHCFAPNTTSNSGKMYVYYR